MADRHSTPRLITLLTDFGTGSPYVAAMKGAILSTNPAAMLVDLTHAVPPQDIREGALVLEEIAPRFPPGTIHVAVVDPGVGTQRAIVYACIAGQHYVAPDNGLLSRLVLDTPPTQVVRLSRAEYWGQPVSATFHGRDIMAPVAARLSLGLDPALLGEPLAGLTTLDWPPVRVTPGRVEGAVLRIDSFGNLITNIGRALLDSLPAARWQTTCRGRTIDGLAETYGQAPPGTFVAVIGSTGRLELALVQGSAAAALGACVGDAVRVEGSVAGSTA